MALGCRTKSGENWLTIKTIDNWLSARQSARKQKGDAKTRKTKRPWREQCSQMDSIDIREIIDCPTYSRECDVNLLHAQWRKCVIWRRSKSRVRLNLIINFQMATCGNLVYEHYKKYQIQKIPITEWDFKRPLSNTVVNIWNNAYEKKALKRIFHIKSELEAKIKGFKRRRNNLII